MEDDSTRAAWDSIAAGYDRTNTVTQMWLGSEGLRRAGLQPGMRFLDVAAGSGALAIPAARLGARVVAVDQSPVMLRLLAERARSEGLEIETRVMDGHALGLEDGSFDMAGSQFGVMLFPDMPRGIREMARVTRRGGSVLMIVYGPPSRLEFLQFLVKAIQPLRPGFTGPPEEPQPLPFQLQDPQRLHTELAAAGLHDVAVESLEEHTEFASGEALWEWIVWSNPIVESVLGCLRLGDDERRQVRAALHQLIKARTSGDRPAVLANLVHLGRARRP